MIFGSIISLISIVEIIISFFGEWQLALSFIFLLIYGVLLIIKALIQKDKIKCSSLLNSCTIKNRLTSDGNVTQDIKLNLIKYIVDLILNLVLIFNVLMTISTLANESISILTIVFVILDVLNIIVSIFSLKGVNEYKYNGKYIYLYKEKYYKFD